MCWFAGFTYSDEILLRSMWKTLEKRATDEEYLYVREWLSFYHAHLKVSDLDKDTSQPYVSDRCIIGLVWEIYNKDEILQSIWVSQSGKHYTELEVIDLAYKKLWETFINIVNGEFAISIFDTRSETYFFYRDRWGVNNLYYRLHNNHLYFASEIKALIIDTPICSKTSMIDHLIFQFWISPETIVQDIYTLRPWTYLVFGTWSIQIKSFSPYVYRDNSSSMIEVLEKSIYRRVPHFQKQIFVWLSGWPDSNLILYFLKKYFKGEIIAYSFHTQKNSKDIEVAIKNAKTLGIQHILIDMNEYEYSMLWEDLYTHEGLVYLPDLSKILKNKFPEYKNVKVEFWGDGKEELILGNNHYPYKEILTRYSYFHKKGLCPSYNITQEFLNKEMFDYNLQMIDKVTLRNGVERRLPFTDYEMLRFFRHKNYRKEAESFLKRVWLDVVQWEYGYDLWIKFENIYDTDLAANKDLLFSHFKNNVLNGL